MAGGAGIVSPKESAISHLFMNFQKIVRNKEKKIPERKKKRALL